MRCIQSAVRGLGHLTNGHDHHGRLRLQSAREHAHAGLHRLLPRRRPVRAPHAARRPVKNVCACGFPTGFFAAIGHCYQLPVLGSRNFKITLPYRKERGALVLFLFSIMRSCNAKQHAAVFYDAKDGWFEKCSAAVSETFVVQ